MSRLDRLIEHLEAAGQAHHAAFAAVDGADPEWAEWYAQRLVAPFEDLIRPGIEAGEIADWLSDLEDRRLAEAPDADWARFYAKEIMQMTDETALEALRYPIGRLKIPGEISPQDRAGHLDRIEATPTDLRAAVAGLDESQLETPYRPGGWTVRQVVHHLVDSHVNSFVRFRWALTEDSPKIKVYDQDAWSELPDSREAPIEMSLSLLGALHERWIFFLRRMTDEDFERTFEHPDWGTVRLDQTLALYAWHGDHHVAHVTRLREREGW